MADFAPPTGPPPPRVPEGWKAVYNDQYHEWFYVNIYTKQSQWDKPTEPAHQPGMDAPPGAPPPGYSAGSSNPQYSDSKKTFESNNPYAGPGVSGGSHETDEELARRLQAEENQRNVGHSPNPGTDRGQSDSYYQSQTGAGGYQSQTGGGGYQSGGYAQQQQSGLLPPRPSDSQRSNSSSGGFLGKLKSKLSSPSGGSQGGYGHQSYGGGGYPQQQQYGGYPQQQYGGYQQQGYGGGMYGQPARKKPGMGVGGAAALGVGGGLLGGMLLADAIDDNDNNDDYGGGGNDDYGGGDDGGGGDF